VIAARSGDIAHADDHRLTRLMRAMHRGPDRLRRRSRAAGTVDTEKDGAHILVFLRKTESAHELVGAGLATSQRIAAIAAAARKHAGRIDQRDGRAALVRLADLVAIFLEREELRRRSERGDGIGPVA